MKQILFIANSCLPVTGPENICNARQLAVLSQSGQFKIDLVTRHDNTTYYPQDDIDKYGIKLNSLHFVDVDNKINFKTVWQHFRAWMKFGVVEAGYHWAYSALPLCERLVKENKYDYIVSKNASSYILAYYLKNKYGIKWIASWNDPFPAYLWIKPYGQGNNPENVKKCRRIVEIMKKADEYVYPNPRLAKYVNSYVQASEKCIHVVPHVMTSKPNDSRKRVEGPIKLIHPGQCNAPRYARTLLQATKELLEEKKINKDDLSITFMGKTNPDEMEMIVKDPLREVVNMRDPVAYHQSLNVLKEYDVALIIEAACEEGIFLPTKVSDFMMAGMRMLAICPLTGVQHDLYEQGYISYFGDVTNVESIKKALLEIVDDSKKTEWDDYNVNVPKSFTADYTVEQFLNL